MKVKLEPTSEGVAFPMLVITAENYSEWLGLMTWERTSQHDKSMGTFNSEKLLMQGWLEKDD